MRGFAFYSVLCACALSLSSLTACNKEQAAEEVKAAEVILNVRTVDLAGKPVESVRFYINGKKFGITDQDGAFQGHYPAKNGETLTFNVEAPQGYSVPPNVDQSRWQLQINYPSDGRPLKVDFTANLQRPERDYLFMVRTKTPAAPVQVNRKIVGKTGIDGDVLLRVSGIPGTNFSARAGTITLQGVFAEDDEIYLMTPERQGPLGGAPAVADADTPNSAEVPAVVAPEPAPAKAEVAAAPSAPEPAKVEPVKLEPIQLAAPEPTPVKVEPAKPAPIQVAAAPVQVEPSRPSSMQAAAPVQVAPSKPSTSAPAVVIAPTPAPSKPSTPAPAVVIAPSKPSTPAPAVVIAPTPAPSRSSTPAPAVVIAPTPAPSKPVVASSAPVSVKASKDDDIIADEPVRPVAVKASKDDIIDDIPVAKPVAVKNSALDDDIIDDIPVAIPVAMAPIPSTPSTPKKAPIAVVDDDIIDDNSQVVAKNAASARTGALASSMSVATMSRQEIDAEVKRIKGKRDAQQVLTAGDVDFLNQIQKGTPSYGEANRLLADYYYDLQDYRRQAAALENATASGPLKRDPQVLLSLAKSYAQQKNYRKALGVMQRVDENSNKLPAQKRGEAMQFYAKTLEFEYMRQYADDPKGANLGLLDKAISQWERFQTFNGGSAEASKKINELNAMKSRMEL